MRPLTKEEQKTALLCVLQRYESNQRIKGFLCIDLADACRELIPDYYEVNEKGKITMTCIIKWFPGLSALRPKGTLIDKPWFDDGQTSDEGRKQRIRILKLHLKKFSKISAK